MLKIFKKGEIIDSGSKFIDIEKTNQNYKINEIKCP